jgi:hypothetical protein
MQHVEKLAKSKHIDWPAVSTWITGEIATTLHVSTEFMGEDTLRDQCWYACQLFRENLVPVVPCSFINKILDIDKVTVKYHYQR